MDEVTAAVVAELERQAVACHHLADQARLVSMMPSQRGQPYLRWVGRVAAYRRVAKDLQERIEELAGGEVGGTAADRVDGDQDAPRGS